VTEMDATAEGLSAADLTGATAEGAGARRAPTGRLAPYEEGLVTTLETTSGRAARSAARVPAPHSPLLAADLPRLRNNHA